MNNQYLSQQTFLTSAVKSKEMESYPYVWQDQQLCSVFGR